ncbi:MAG: gamma-glutamyltransferase [Phycisphaerales bacterium]
MRGVRMEGPFPRGVVAADHELASRAGAGVLRAGGNAVDAAVATSLALSVVRPYSCGIGGGGFMIVRMVDDGTGQERITAFDYREAAPAAVEGDYFSSAGRSSTRGGTSVAVPGTVAGLVTAHERFGRLPLSKVVQPAIELAERGFPADAHYAAMAQDLIGQFEEHPEWKQRFSFVWERMLLEGKVEVGSLIRVPEQAGVLRLIAERGRAGFYEGEVARQIVHRVRRDGGDITLEDLRTYRPREFEPVRARVFGYAFVGMPPPSSGGVTMVEALRIMEAAGYEIGRPDDADNVHLMVEAIKHAFADRARWFGDPSFVDVPVERLLDDANVRARAEQIDRAHTQPTEAYGSRLPLRDDGGTSHFCVVDAEGNAVACTETINLEFGSLLAVDAFGFVLNDEMDDFVSVRGEPNAFGLVQGEQNLPAPGKRPLSSMAPTMVFDDQGLLVVAGASGGPRIITATLQVILNVLAGASAGEAVSTARLHHQWMPDRLELEPDAWRQGDLRARLESMGHVLGERSQIGCVQVIRRAERGWDAACDPRKGGRPAGD